MPLVSFAFAVDAYALVEQLLQSFFNHHSEFITSARHL